MESKVLSIHFNTASIDLKSVQSLVSQWTKKHRIDLIELEVVYHSPSYQFLQKYGLPLDTIKYLTSLSPDHLNFWKETVPTDYSLRRMFEYVNAHKGNSLFIGPLEGGVGEEFQLANEYQNIGIIQIESEGNEN